MVFTRILRNLIRDQELGPRIVPIIPDEARTFGMDPLFKEVGIYSALGQRYEPVDSDLVLSYREATDGQVLEEGITEAGSMASFQAAGTAYASHGLATIPFYIFYSMFGFQRTGDQMWAFGDARGRGFLMGATAGRTTLTGEGLQHDDGHTHILASTVPNLRAYDPAFAYELAAVVRDGIERMYGPKPEDVFYYITLYNENYPQPVAARGRDRRGDPARHLPLRGGARPRPRRAPGAARRLGLDPPAGPRRPRPARRAARRRRRGLQRAVVPAAPPRRARGRALEPAAPRRQDAARPARQPGAAVEGGPIVAATDWMKAPAGHGQPLAAAALRRARHRRLRPERHARGAARALRDRSAAHRGGDARRARPLRRAWTGQGGQGDPRRSASTPRRRTRSRSRRSRSHRASGSTELPTEPDPGDAAPEDDHRGESHDRQRVRDGASEHQVADEASPVGDRQQRGHGLDRW